MPPSLDGSYVFGTAVRMDSGNASRESQENSYFGLGGIQHMDGGERGRETRGSCLLYGVNLEALVTACDQLESFDDGQPHELVDTKGRQWGSVLCKFREKNPWFSDALGGCYQAYEFSFKHLQL